MGFPALSAELSPTATESRSVAAPCGLFDAVVPDDDRFDLRAIIESVFDLDEDLLLYELQDPPYQRQGDTRRLIVPGGTGLSAAVACAQGRARLGAKHFIVVVLDPSQWTSELADEVDGLSAIDERLLVIAPVDTGNVAAFAKLEGAGWRIDDLTEQSSARSIAKAMVAARADGRATALLIDKSLTAILATGLSNRIEKPTVAVGAAPKNAEQALAYGLQHRARVDVRVAPIVLVDDPLWSSISDENESVNGACSVSRLERGLWQAVALSRSKIHSVIVADQKDLDRQPEVLVRVLRCLRSNCTLIVLNASYGGRGLLLPDGAFEVTQHWLPDRATAESAQRALSECLLSSCLSVLHVPKHVPEWITLNVTPVVGDGRRDAAARVESGYDGQRLLSKTGIPFAVSAKSAQLDQLEIQRKQLSPEVQEWVRLYDLIGHRDVYLWRWCLHGIELTTFSDVPEEYRAHLYDTKLLSVIICVLFDDIADRHGPSELLESMIQSASAQRGAALNGSDEQQHYLDVTTRLWQTYESRARNYPLFPVYERLLRFDLLQFLNTMRYAHLVNSQPGLINPIEHDVYSPHNMLMVSFSTLDLTCVTSFDSAELGNLREAMWHAQAMGRIGNVLSTWRREVGEADQSSGLFAFDQSLPTTTREQFLFEKWRWHRNRCHAAAQHVHSLNLNPVLAGHDRFLDMHLASAGRI